MNAPIRNLVVLEAPAYEPVSLAIARSYCRYDADDTDQDNIVRLLIAAARERAEEITGRAFIERRLELRLDQFPDGDAAIELPMPPLQTVEYIRYIDTAGAQQELSGSPDAFLTDSGSTPGRIAPLYGASWPASNGQPGSVRIGYRCGYAPAAGSPNGEEAYQANLPGRLKQWMAARISTWDLHREHLDMATVKDLPRDFVDGLLDGLRVHRLFA